MKSKILLLASISFILLAGCSSSVKTNCNIKGNISFDTKEKIYHLPTCDYYNETDIDTSYGEKRFCSEKEAKKSGWRKAKNC